MPPSDAFYKHHKTGMANVVKKINLSVLQLQDKRG
jgi:hypothetical protein